MKVIDLLLENKKNLSLIILSLIVSITTGLLLPTNKNILWMLVLLIGIFVFYETIIKRTEAWILITLIYSASILKIVGEEANIINLPGGISFTVTESLVGILIIILVFHHFLNRKSLGFSLTGIIITLYLLIFAIFSLRDGLFLGQDLRLVLNLSRANYLLVFYFIIFWGINTRTQLRWLLWGILIVASFTAIVTIIQAWIGPDIRIMPGTSRLRTMPDQPTIVQVIPPGIALIIPVFFAVVHNWVNKGALKLKYFYIFILALAILITTTRSIWISTFLGLLIGISFLKKFKTVIIVLLIFIFLLIFLQSDVDIIQNTRVHVYSGLGLSNYDLDPNSQLRINEWQYGWSLLTNSITTFSFGIGWESLKTVSQIETLVPESGWLQIFIATGMLGCFLLLVLGILGFKSNLKAMNILSNEPMLQSFVFGFMISIPIFLLLSVSFSALNAKPQFILVFALSLAIPDLVTRLNKEGELLD